MSEEITDEESLAPEVQRAVRNRAVIILTSLETAYVCSPMVYKGLVTTRTFPTNPEKGWVVVASENCVTPDRVSMDAGWIAMYTGSSWFVYCGNATNKCNSGVDAYTVLMMHCDGTSGSQVFTDSSASAHGISTLGDSQVSTAQYVFGGASAFLDGSGDYLYMPNSSDWDFGTGDFCIDFRMRRNGSYVDRGIIGTSTGSTLRGWTVQLGGDGLNTLMQLQSNASGIWQRDIISVTTIPDLTWTHVAIIRDSNTLRIFLNGVQDVTADATGSVFNSAGAGMDIGRYHVDVDNYYYYGWLDELRISKGTSRIRDPNDMLYIPSGDPEDGFIVPTCAYGGA